MSVQLNDLRVGRRNRSRDEVGERTAKIQIGICVHTAVYIRVAIKEISQGTYRIGGTTREGNRHRQRGK